VEWFPAAPGLVRNTGQNDLEGIRRAALTRRKMTSSEWVRDLTSFAVEQGKRSGGWVDANYGRLGP
jgi:hypothetical protein